MSENPGNNPNPSPEPINPFKGLSRAGIAGAILGVVGIVLFLACWAALGQAGMQQLPRLLLSLCIPPLLIGIGILVYALISRSRS